MKKKVFLSLFLVLILLANISFASYSTVTMSVVKEPVCTIELGEKSNFEKRLISKDLANKEVTLQLKITNGEVATKPSGELILVLDNSNSMETEVSTGKTRKDLIFESAKSLITNLLKDNTQLKIGIVGFSSNVDLSKEGSAEDAFVVSQLTNNATTLNNAISNIQTNGTRTNLQSGVQLGSKQFSKSAENKYMIVLTDGVPNLSIDWDKKYYSDDVISKTKEELISTKDNDINLITMLTGINNEDSVAGTTEKTFGEIIPEIFGTQEKPTAGKFYYVTDDKAEETITTEIYNSLMPITKAYKDIVIKDYFPEEIIKNFNFAYVTQASKGNISAKVDTTDNSITWTIPELANGETSTVQYKLKLKENFDSNIVNKILNTNKKVDITYKDFDDKKQEKTSDISPQLKLTEPPIVLPKAGIMTISIVLMVIVFAILSTIKFINFNKNTK